MLYGRWEEEMIESEDAFGTPQATPQATRGL